MKTVNPVSNLFQCFSDTALPGYYVILSHSRYPAVHAICLALMLCFLPTALLAVTWNGGGSDNLASTPANWGGIAPAAGDAIVLNTTSHKNMIWNMTNMTVASWSQIGYTGTVTIATVYGTTEFTNLNITGNCVISNGVWTHIANTTTEANRLMVSIGGDLTVGADAALDVSEKGYAAGRGPGAPPINNNGGGSYGGRGGVWGTDFPRPCYGSIIAPTNLGSGGGWSQGGGAMLLITKGTLRHDGVMAANGKNDGHHTGSGGSVYLIAGAMIGSGAIRANAGVAGGQGPGGGGRVALVVTNEGANFLFYSGIVESMGHPIGAKSASGTIYREKHGDLPGNGELIVKGTGSANNYDCRTDLNGIDAVTYEFSRITLTNACVIGLLTNNTLILTHTEMHVDATNINEGIVLAGGTLIVPDEFVFSNVFIRIAAPNSTFSPKSRLIVGTNGIFEMDRPHAMTSDVIIAAGGLLTHSANNDTEAYKIDLTLDGNLTVNNGGRIDATGKGYAAGRGPGYPILNYSGGGSHGGRGEPYNTSLIAPCYGSLTAPMNIGSGGSSSAGGGAIRLKVSGTVVNNGQMLADGQASGNHAGAGGSLLVMAGSMSGTGPFRANGGDFSASAGAGGGGRVALVVTNANAGFSACTDVISAYGGHKTAASGGGSGTVYLRDSDHGPGTGTLIVDNNNLPGLCTEINSNVTDTTVGNVLIQRSGNLLLNTNQTLTVSGIWSNAAGFMGFTDAMVIFTGGSGSTSTLYGSTSFKGLVCITEGKTLLFQAASTNGVEAGGRFWFKGIESEPVKLRSTTPGTAWKINVDPAADQAVEHGDVQDSDALGGAEITAMNSVNSDRNVNWRFLSVFPGQTNTWTGGESTTWSERGNWDLDRPPNGTDMIVIPANKPRYPALDADRTIHALSIQEGASLELANRNLTITNNLIVAGTLIASGTEIVTLLKDADFTGGFFESARSTLILAGSAAQYNNLAGAIFYKIRVENSVAPVTLSGGFIAMELRCEAPNGAPGLRFEPNKTVTLRDLVLRGALPGATNIILESAIGGVPWKLAVSGYRSVTGVKVKDSDASQGLPIPAMASENRGGNSNWKFGVAPALWLGTSGNNFHTAANWDTTVVPDAATRVLVESANPMAITGTVSILDLTIGGSIPAATVTINGLLTVGESVNILQNGTLSWNKPGVVSNDLVVADGGLLTHAGNSSVEVNKIDLLVLGNVGVDATGVVDVTGMGHAAGSGPGGAFYGNSSGGSYGGRGGMYITDNTKPCYGSITAPTNLGSGGGYTAGGGAIVIKAEGTIRHDGAMIADGVRSSSYYAGSGGTISLRAASLLGIGLVRANGGDYSSTTSPGGGGRVALVVTNEDADFTKFTGTVLTRGGRAAGLGAPLAGAGTIYRQTGFDIPGRGTVHVENDNANGLPYTDVPPYTNALPGEVDRAAFHIVNGARLKLRDDFMLGDIWLDTANTVLDLGAKTLTIRSRKHELGAGIITNYGAIIWWPDIPKGIVFSTW